MSEKIIKSISLSSHVIKHINSNGELSNFSKWVEDAYKNEFMKIETLEERKQQIQKELTEWKIQKESFKMNELKKESIVEHIWSKLNDKSKFYLLRVPELVLKGYDIKATHRSFCGTDLGYNITLEEYTQLIEYNKKNCDLKFSPVASLN